MLESLQRFLCMERTTLYLLVRSACIDAILFIFLVSGTNRLPIYIPYCMYI